MNPYVIDLVRTVVVRHDLRSGCLGGSRGLVVLFVDFIKE